MKVEIQTLFPFSLQDINGVKRFSEFLNEEIGTSKYLRLKYSLSFYQDSVFSEYIGTFRGFLVYPMTYLSVTLHFTKKYSLS